MKPDVSDLTDKIIRYEDGEMEEEELVQFFAELVRSGMAWTLQGHYGRTAQALIERGLISRKGEVLNPDAN